MQDNSLRLYQSFSPRDFGDFSVDENSRRFDLSTSGPTRTSISDTVDEDENRYFGHHESRRVRNLKSLVFLVLFLVTMAVCLVICFFTTKGEKADFKAS